MWGYNFCFATFIRPIQIKSFQSSCFYSGFAFNIFLYSTNKGNKMLYLFVTWLCTYLLERKYGFNNFKKNNLYSFVITAGIALLISIISQPNNLDWVYFSSLCYIALFQSIWFCIDVYKSKKHVKKDKK